MNAAAPHRDAVEPLKAWYKAARASKWRNLVDVRKQFPKADQTGKVLIFDIKGNRYRLITTVNYNQARVWVKDFLTHAEYDRKEWMKWA